jgi:hypothetical protein
MRHFSKIIFANPSTLLVVLLLLSLNTDPTLAQAKEFQWRTFLGYKSLTVDYDFIHDTHPDDFFLSNASVAGSAGTTEINGRKGYFAFGGGGTVSKGRNSYSLDLGILYGKYRDIQQNINDVRSPYNAAFIYSEINWGLFAAASADYKFSKSFRVGALAQLGGVFIESGWDRYNSDQRVNTTLKLVPSIGPKIGFYFIEATIQFGKHVDYGVQAVYSF